MQREDFVGILREMAGKPVTIRLLDPPLHEFLPQDEAEIRKLAADMGVDPKRLKQVRDNLAEFNPMLGHRGSRLGISYPEIYQAQARAIIEATTRIAARRRQCDARNHVAAHRRAKEFEFLAKEIREVAKRDYRKGQDKLSYRSAR